MTKTMKIAALACVGGAVFQIGGCLQAAALVGAEAFVQSIVTSWFPLGVLPALP